MNKPPGIDDWQVPYYWRVNYQRVFLKEISQVAKLDNEQAKYFAAYRYFGEGHWEIHRLKDNSARRLLERSLQGFIESVGEQSASAGSALEALSTVERSRCDFKVAKRCAERALAIRRNCEGKDGLLYPNTQVLIAFACVDLGELDEAESLYRQAIERERKMTGTDRLCYVRWLVSFAHVCTKKGRLAEAEALLCQARQICADHGQENVFIGATWHNMAEISIARGRYNEAEGFYQRCLNLCDRTSQESSPLVAQMLEQYAMLLRKLNRSEDAKRCETRAKEIRAEHDKEDPPQ